MVSRREQLTDVFHKWEHRGRGSKLWPNRVSPEPLFVPFFGHGAYILSEVTQDDGRVETISSLLTKPFRRRTPQPDNSMAIKARESLEYPSETPDYLLEYRDKITEIKIALPVDFTSDQLTFEYFLASISSVTYPLSFEIIGRADKIDIIITCAASDHSTIIQQLETHFPDLMVLESEGIWEKIWMADLDSPNIIAELGLKDSFVVPLSAPGQYQRDPLNGLIGTLNYLEEGEVALYQVIFQPVYNSWSESIVRSVQAPDGSAFFESDLLPYAREKISKPLFGVVMRIAVKSPDPRRLKEVGRNMVANLTAFTDSGRNSLVPLKNDGIDPLQHQVDLLLRMSHRSGMLLNSSELISLIHFPSSSVRAGKLERDILKTKEAPAEALHKDLILGDNTHRGITQTVGLNNEQRTRHMYLIGASGSGKSTLMLNSIIQDIQNGHGLGVLDPHGDLIEKIIPHIPEERLEDVILLDPSDEESSIAFNILSAHSELEKGLLASDLTSLFRKFATSWGDQMTAVLDNAILAFLNSTRGGTLVDVKRFLVEKDFRNEYLKTVTDEQVVYYWHKEFPLLQGRPQASILTRLSTFLRPKPIRHMVAQEKNKLDLAKVMDEGKILLAKISHGLIGEDNAHLLGALLVSKINQVIMGRQSIEAEKRRDFWLYIDEFHHFVTESMSNILTGARKYRLGLILANQELRQIESRDPEVASSVISNPYTRVCFRLGDQDAKKLSDGFSAFSAEDLQNLKIGQAICRVGQADHDFNITSTLPPEFDEEVARQKTAFIVEHTHKTYGTPREEVEQFLSAQFAQEMGTVSKKETVKPAEPERPVAKTATPEPKPEPPPIIEEKEYAKNAHSSVEQDSIQKPVKKESSSPAEEQEEKMEKSPTRGRGGKQHQALQQQFKMLGEGFGYMAGIEEATPDGKSVDISLAKEGMRIAIEVSITTPTEKEVENINKCLKAGYDEILMTSPNPNHLENIRKRARSEFDHESFSKIHFLDSDQVSDHLNSLEVKVASKQTQKHGRWSVKTNYKTASELSEVDKKGKLKNISNLAQDTAKKLNKKKTRPRKGDRDGLDH